MKIWFECGWGHRERRKPKVSKDGFILSEECPGDDKTGCCGRLRPDIDKMPKKLKKKYLEVLGA
jgi:hypothetical protein